MTDERYRVDTIHAASLAGNLLGSPVERKLTIYLPPDYFQSAEKKYPVIYLLHGYQGNPKTLTVAASLREKWSWIPASILEQIDWSKTCDYGVLDTLIGRGELNPFILVQPDASLQLPDKDGTYDFFSGEIRTKGSFYINSRHAGNYEDYIVRDIIQHIDANYRTLNERRYRALMGVSMGGYGTLSILCHHADKFAGGAALSPANFTVDMLDWKLVIPLMEKMTDRAAAEKSGTQLYEDILDTQDIVFSREKPLMPSVVRDGSGRSISWDKDAAAIWDNYDINRVATKHASNLKQVNLLMNCESSDEFGLTGATGRIHSTFKQLGIKHEYEIYSDPAAAALSAHVVGIFYHMIPAMRFCLGHLV
jgi:S-formylglutathione hydrolase